MNELFINIVKLSTQSSPLISLVNLIGVSLLTSMGISVLLISLVLLLSLVG
jgi:hypothetical protein